MRRITEQDIQARKTWAEYSKQMDKTYLCRVTPTCGEPFERYMLFDSIVDYTVGEWYKDIEILEEIL